MSTTRSAARLSVAQLELRLRAWIRTHDAHVRAAVLLLIEHGFWLRHHDFRALAVRITADDEVLIQWRAASSVLRRSCCSATEQAVLDLAIALATDRYRLRSMGEANSSAITRAVAAAAGAEMEPEVVLVDATEGGSA